MNYDMYGSKNKYKKREEEVFSFIYLFTYFLSAGMVRGKCRGREFLKRVFKEKKVWPE